MTDPEIGTFGIVVLIVVGVLVALYLIFTAKRASILVAKAALAIEAVALSAISSKLSARTCATRIR